MKKDNIPGFPGYYISKDRNKYLTYLYATLNIF